MKTLEFIYQDTQIHFLLNPTDDNVMVNATEMAKAFDKRTDHYLQNSTTKELINELKVPEISGTLEPKIVDNRGRNGIWFHQDLAIDFAMWLDVKFRVWVCRTIREMVREQIKPVQNAVDNLVEKENALISIREKIQNSDNKQAKELLVALSEYESAKKSKTKVLTLLSKQMRMDI